MISKTIIFTISFCLGSFVYSFAQSKCEVELMRKAFAVEETNKTYLSAKNNSNEVQYFFSGLFLFYKTFISSQDGQSCSFTPSCSEYGIMAVKKHGVLAGMVITFDRLARCNGLSPEKYIVDEKKHLLIDLVE